MHLCHSNVSVFPQTQTHHLKADIHSSLQMFLIQLLLQAVILIITCCVRVALADCFYMLSNAIKIKFLPSLDPRRCLLALLRPKFNSESLPTSRPLRSTVVLIYPLIVSWWVWCLSVKQSGISFSSCRQTRCRGAPLRWGNAVSFDEWASVIWSGQRSPWREERMCREERVYADS